MVDLTQITDRLGGIIERLTGPNTLGKSRVFWWGFAVVLLVLVAQPFFRGTYAVNQFTLYLSYGLLGLSLTLIWGYAGILSFGQVAFFGIAGYTYAIVSLNLETTYDPALAGTIALGTAILTATAAAFVLGYFMFYGDVRDVYVAIMTLVVTLVLNTFLDQTAGAGWTIGSVPLGGFNGIPGIGDFILGGGGLRISLTDIRFYWFVLGVTVAIYLGLRVVLNGRIGYALVAIREDEDRAEMLGYNVRRLKLGVFTAAGALAGLGGVFYVTWTNYVSPRLFTLAFATIPIVWVSFGGRKSLAGALVGTISIEWVRQWFSINAAEYAIVFVGVVLLASILLMPRGVVPGVHDIYVFFARRGIRGGLTTAWRRLRRTIRSRIQSIRTTVMTVVPNANESRQEVSRE